MSCRSYRSHLWRPTTSVQLHPPRHPKGFRAGLASDSQPPFSSSGVYNSAAAVEKLRERLAQRAGRSPGAIGRQPFPRAAGRDAINQATSQMNRAAQRRPSRPQGISRRRRSHDDMEEESDEGLDEGPEESDAQEAEFDRILREDVLLEEPHRPVVPFDPTPAGEWETYEHPGLPTMSTGNVRGVAKMEQRIWANRVSLPSHRLYADYDMPFHAAQETGWYKTSLDSRKPLVDRAKPGQKDKVQQHLQRLHDRYIDGKFDVPGQEDPDELVSETGIRIASNGSYGTRDVEMFMAKIKALIPRPNQSATT